MVRLSVNINKVALLRNSREGNNPDLLHFATVCEQFGAQGITVHPRPDERHIRYSDVPALLPIVKTEFNIEGNPTPDFIDLVLKNKPHQVTLVPDSVDQLTSDHGWDTITYQEHLKSLIQQFHQHGIRVSIFVDPVVEMIDAAKTTGTDRIELYTGPYAEQYHHNREAAIAPYKVAANAALRNGIGVNAGHDLNLDNLAYFVEQIPNLLEVSIGHALIKDALYMGIEETIQRYLQCLKG